MGGVSSFSYSLLGNNKGRQLIRQYERIREGFKVKESQTVTARIGLDFNKEIEEIKKERINSGIDKKKKSTKNII